MEYLGAWGTLIHENNLKSKISCQTPFKILTPCKVANNFKKNFANYPNNTLKYIRWNCC
jgi:hypothetical protein